MSETNLKRSLYRSVAVLLIPISGSSTLPAVVESALPGISSVVGIVLFVGAVLYLVGSTTRQVSAAADTPF